MASLPNLSNLDSAPERDALRGLGPTFGDVDYQVMLETDGFVVIPTPVGINRGMLKQVQDAFDNHFHESPELIHPRPLDNDWYSVLGGFAAHGNPSSFHHPFVRKLREMCEAVVIDADALPLHGRNLEQCFDRLMRRPKGMSASAESWHRDESLNTLPSDDIYGGWINLDSEPQYFSCAPGTHLEEGARERNNGFSKIAEKSEKERYRVIAYAHGQVEIPPGFMLIFYERLVHEVISKKATHLMRRMFLGWRATLAVQPLFGSDVTHQWMDTQQPPLIKSGQTARMYSQLHANLHIDKIKQFSETGWYKPQCIRSFEVKGSADKWYTNQIHPRIDNPMKSLVDYGLPLHKAYEHAEKMIMMPHSSISLYTFDSPTERVTYDLVSMATWQQHTVHPIAMDSQGRATRRPRPTRV